MKVNNSETFEIALFSNVGQLNCYQRQRYFIVILSEMVLENSSLNSFFESWCCSWNITRALLCGGCWTKRELPSMFQANPSGEAEFAAGIYFEHTIQIFYLAPIQLLSSTCNIRLKISTCKSRLKWENLWIVWVKEVGHQ